jgi:hypothetical protein
MLLRENELGWRLYKTVYGFAITRAHLPLRSHLVQLGPAALNLLLIAAAWLLGGDTKRMQPALYALPFTFLIGLYCFRPGVLYVRPRHRTLGDTAGGVPFSWLRIEVDQDCERGLHRVYLKGAEPLEQTETHTREWKRLAWEANTEAEASAIAEEFHAWGISTPDPLILTVKADKRLRLIAYGGHVLSVVVLIGFLMRMLHGGGKKPAEVEPEVVLRIVQIIIAFVFLSMLPFATYLWRLGRGAIRSRLMPPPEMRIIKDMRLIEGDKAVGRGRRMAAIGFVLMMAGLVGGLYLPYKLGKVFGEQLRPAPPAASSRR